jgi:hypothetical protein
MNQTAIAALEHIRLMQARIEQQTALIVQRRASGEDTLEAARRLTLLHRALEEMRMLLGQLLPTEAKNTLRSVG